jgi:hypothetical protein
MEQPEDDLFDDPTIADPDDDPEPDEDHRGDNPGFDLDEQEAIEDLEDEDD